jgi:hypothetical protein
MRLPRPGLVLDTCISSMPVEYKSKHHVLVCVRAGKRMRKITAVLVLSLEKSLQHCNF